jgi:hypothetical protein
MENTKESAKLMAGICPQCGGQLEVDPTQEAAVCPYCGTPYVVSKAINNYNVQNAHIDHVDNLHVDLKGSVDSIIGLAEREFDKNRAERREEKRQFDETSKSFFQNFWKFFLILVVVMMVFWLVANKLGVFN